MAYHPPEIPESHKGLLHRKLHIKPGQKISLGELMKTKERAKREGDVKLEREANFAEVAKKWNH